MRAQNELSAYFTEIDRRTDNALKGIRQVRRSAKLQTLPPEPRMAAIGSAFLVVLAFFIALFID